ncbi:terminase, partial [Pseudoalteromonas sp. S1609]
TQNKWPITYVSRPRVTRHEAYEHWTGKLYVTTNGCNDPEFAIDASHKNLTHGLQCDAGIWRPMLTVHDVVKSGIDRIDIDVLENEYSTDE